MTTEKEQLVLTGTILKNKFSRLYFPKFVLAKRKYTVIFHWMFTLYSLNLIGAIFLRQGDKRNKHIIK